MAIIIFWLVIFIVVGNVIYSVMKQSGQAGNRTNRRMWSETAYTLHMNLMPPDDHSPFPSMRGMVNGVYTEVWGDFDEKGFPVLFCRTDYALSLPFRLCILKGQFEGEAVGESFQISTLSSPEVAISASDGEELQKFLTPQNMNVLKNTLSIYNPVKITDSFLVIGASGIHDTLTFCSFIDRTVSAAKILSDGHTVSSTQRVPKTVAPVQEEVPPPEIRIPAAKPAEVKLPVLEEEEIPEVVTPVPKKPMPTAIPVAVPVSKPAEPVAKPVVIAEAEPTPANAVSRESAIPAEEEITVDFLTGLLFQNSFPGVREKTLFQQYIGRRVSWSGTLKSVHSYSSDFVFGKGPGVKATFEIADVASGYGMKKKVKATVSLSNEMLPLLKGENGKNFRFSGTLLKFEPFASEILLEKGALEG